MVKAEDPLESGQKICSSVRRPKCGKFWIENAHLLGLTAPI